MYWNSEITTEDEEELIKKIAERICKAGIEFPASMIFGALQPFSRLGGQMAQFFISPFLIPIGDDIGQQGEKIFRIFGKPENVEKLITLIEKLEKEKEKSKMNSEREKDNQIKETGEAPKKRGWKRFLPFINMY